MIKHNLTGYYIGTVLFIVFWLPEVKKYAHCSMHGYFIQDTPIPEGYEEFFSQASPESV